MNNIIVDGHSDTIQVAFDNNKNIDDNTLSFNIKDAKRPMIQMLASFIHPKYEKSFERAKKIIDYFYEQYKKFSNEIILVKSKEDIDKVICENKIGVILTIENGRAIENKIENIDYFYNQGIRVMSINWNEDNLLGCGALTKNDNGLTNFGAEYIKKLNEKNIIVDISHSSQKTFWDAVKVSNKPIVATHSCCMSLCNHPRNLDDDQIKQIAKMRGIIGVCYCNSFLSINKEATSKDIAKHISYIANLVGIEYVGLGSDFDGLEKENIPKDIKGIKDINLLEDELQNIGFNKEEIKKIFGENWLRVLKENIL